MLTTFAAATETEPPTTTTTEPPTEEEPPPPPCRICGRGICGVKHGDITGNGRIEIVDAIEIFKHFAKIDNIITTAGKGTREWRAALITPQSNQINTPTIMDAVEILKYLAGMNSIFLFGDFIPPKRPKDVVQPKQPEVIHNFTITQRPSPNRTKGRQGHVPDHFVLHTSGGTFQSAINTVLNPANEVSYHFLISRTGEIVQFVDIRDWAYANGTNNSGGNLDNKHSTLPLVRQRRVNANWYTVSIAFADMPSGNPSKEQLDAAAWLMNHVNRELQKIYGTSIPLTRDRVVGHGEITPITRANCPGKNFPFTELIKLANSLQ